MRHCFLCFFHNTKCPRFLGAASGTGSQHFWLVCSAARSTLTTTTPPRATVKHYFYIAPHDHASTNTTNNALQRLQPTTHQTQQPTTHQTLQPTLHAPQTKVGTGKPFQICSRICRTFRQIPFFSCESVRTGNILTKYYNLIFTKK